MSDKLDSKTLRWAAKELRADARRHRNARVAFRGRDYILVGLERQSASLLEFWAHRLDEAAREAGNG